MQFVPSCLCNTNTISTKENSETGSDINYVGNLTDEGIP
jgi:hypothetical protein